MYDQLCETPLTGESPQRKNFSHRCSLEQNRIRKARWNKSSKQPAWWRLCRQQSLSLQPQFQWPSSSPSKIRLEGEFWQ